MKIGYPATLGVTLVLCLGPSSQAQQLTVGKNAHVSADWSDAEHGEVVIATDPNDADHLMGASMVVSGRQNRFIVAVYTSFDGGSTWRRTLETSRYALSGDPSVAFGPGGEAYLVLMTAEEPRTVLGHLSVYTSHDGGRTWEQTGSVPNSAFDYLDREHIAVDTSGGKYHGRIYIHSFGTTRDFDTSEVTGSINLYRSYDGGADFNGPVKRISTGTRQAFAPGNSVVLSDGTLAIVFPEIKHIGRKDGPMKFDPSKPYDSNARLKVITSRDGGESLDAAVTVGDHYLDWEGGPGGRNSFLPSIAADTGSDYFRDRLYVAWPDNRSGRGEILFSYSTDKGRTWSLQQVISDNRAFNPDAPSEGPNNYLPSVVVNPGGVVGVSWYDRRDHPEDLGYDVRFAASLDGGETFTSSVKVSEASHLRTTEGPLTLTEGAGGGFYKGVRVFHFMVNMFHYSGGHTAGMAAAADGTFHPIWIDNRTGMAQVWTASVGVAGTVLPHGSLELAAMEEISDKVEVLLTNITFDRARSRISADAQIQNASDMTVEGPLKMRMVTVRSDLGRVHVVHSDNGMTGPGAVVDLSASLPDGGLQPGGVSAVTRLVFLLEDPLPEWRDRQLKWNALWVESHLFATVR